MLFDELVDDLNGLTYEVWVENVHYDTSWTDRQIYDALPDVIKPWLGEFGLNASWYHGGM